MVVFSIVAHDNHGKRRPEGRKAGAVWALSL